MDIVPSADVIDGLRNEKRNQQYPQNRDFIRSRHCLTVNRENKKREKEKYPASLALFLAGHLISCEKGEAALSFLVTSKMKLERPSEDSLMEEENARLRGDLLTIATRISHDLRTPLGGIVTAAEVLREMMAEVNRPETLTQAILNSVDDMTRLIRQISFVTRATAVPQPVKPVNMAVIVALAQQRTERLSLKRGATVIGPPSWPEVKGVSDWLEFIWASLLTNAVQHTAEKVRIELSWRQENGQCRFGIADNGGGVREDLRSTLFYPFHLLHKPEGSRGLGLSVVQRLVELQGGNCGYEPLSGGSLFYFSLPVGPQAPD